MHPSSEQDIRRRIETQYLDAAGRQRRADPEVVERIAAAMADRVGGRHARARGRAAATLLRAPPRAFQGRGDRRMWALGVQLYGIRSQRNWGHGDFTDLAMLLELAADLGAAGIGLNPLHCLFVDDAEAASPYSPNSRLFLNPLYIDLDAVPEFPGAAAAGVERDIAGLRGRDLVDYAGVARAKTAALRLAYARFRQDAGLRQHDFERFRQDRGAALARFARFELRRRSHVRPWWDWPASDRHPVAAICAISGEDEIEATFFAYVQWLAEQQLQACCRKARDLGLQLGLYLDVAVGVRPDGFDAWNDQDAILPRLRIGAPPDPFNLTGQDWGLAAFNPIALEALSFEPFRATLAAAMRHAGAIRIDHVLGLNRLYLIPEGLPPDRGAYVRYPLKAMLAVVAQESAAHRCIVIGEDLGTVPPGLRETLADWGIWSYQVMLFERARDGSFAPPDNYRSDSLATFGTHDLPTFAGWTSGHDLEVKRSLGIDPGESHAERQAALRQLRRALAARGAPDTDFLAIASYLAETPSRLLVIAVEDALGVRDQANLPGTINQHPNWRRRLPVDLEELRAQSGLNAIAKAMLAAGRSN